MGGLFPLGGDAFGGAGEPGINTVEVEVADGLELGAALTPEWFRQVSDGFAMADQLSYSWGPSVNDSFSLTAAAAATGQLMQLVADSVSFSDAVAVAWELALADGFSLADTPAAVVQKLAVAADVLRIVDTGLSQVEAIMAVVAGFALADSVNPVFDAAAMDTIEFTTAAIALAEFMQTVGDGFNLTDAAAGSARVVAVITDAVALQDAVVTQLTAFQAVEDGFNLAVTFKLGEEVYYAYVLHPQPVDKSGTRPVTEYRGFNFNSFATSPQGRYFAAGDGGIYLLEGEDDAGTAIDAWLRSGLDRLGSPNRKRLPELFLVLRARDRAMFVKVVSVNTRTGKKEEDWYDLIPGPVAGDGIRQNQVRGAQGIVSVHWQLELRNRDGADFDLSEMRFYPLHTDRS